MSTSPLGIMALLVLRSIFDKKKGYEIIIGKKISKKMLTI